MAYQRRMTWTDGESVKVGDQLMYVAGTDDYFCESRVTVTEVGQAGCQVKIDQICSQGEKSTVKVGDPIGAGWSELEITENN
jgi:hypothetical protein